MCQYVPMIQVSNIKHPCTCPASPVIQEIIKVKWHAFTCIQADTKLTTAQVSLYQFGVEMHCAEFFVHVSSDKDELSAPTFVFPNHLFVCMEKFETLVLKCKNLAKKPEG